MSARASTIIVLITLFHWNWYDEVDVNDNSTITYYLQGAHTKYLPLKSNLDEKTHFYGIVFFCMLYPL